MDNDPKASGEWARQSGQYLREPMPPPTPPVQAFAFGGLSNSLKVWIGLLPFVLAVVGFVGGYAGKAYKEGETQQKIVQLEADVKRNREDIKEINQVHVTQKYLDDRIKDLKEDREASEKRLMERLAEIKKDLR